jgi:hypothetical protein
LRWVQRHHADLPPIVAAVMRGTMRALQPLDTLCNTITSSDSDGRPHSLKTFSPSIPSATIQLNHTARSHDMSQDLQPLDTLCNSAMQHTFVNEAICTLSQDLQPLDTLCNVNFAALVLRLATVSRPSAPRYPLQRPTLRTRVRRVFPWPFASTPPVSICRGHRLSAEFPLTPRHDYGEHLQGSGQHLAARGIDPARFLPLLDHTRPESLDTAQPDARPGPYHQSRPARAPVNAGAAAGRWLGGR